MKKFGKSLSNASRKYRAKRIDVNVKINVFAYLVEVLGGIIVCCLALVPIPIFVYAAILVWYGIVIPSCYLINSSESKKYIIEKGWVSAISILYRKKDPRDKHKPVKSKDSASCKNDIERRSPQSDTTQEDESNRWASRPKPRTIETRQKNTSKTCENDSCHREKFTLRRGVILQDLEDIS
jgi:hypothetical protein